MKRATNILTIRSYGVSFEDKKESYEKEVNKKREINKYLCIKKEKHQIKSYIEI